MNILRLERLIRYLLTACLVVANGQKAILERTAPMAYIRPKPIRLHTMVETPEFLSAAKHILTDAERNELHEVLANITAKYKKGVKRNV